MAEETGNNNLDRSEMSEIPQCLPNDTNRDYLKSNYIGSCQAGMVLNSRHCLQFCGWCGRPLEICSSRIVKIFSKKHKTYAVPIVLCAFRNLYFQICSK